jgi:endoglucanase
MIRPQKRVYRLGDIAALFFVMGTGCIVFHGSAPSKAFAQAEQELIVNGTFDNGSGDSWWSWSQEPPNPVIQVVDGRLCVDAKGGSVNRWEVSVGQDNIRLIKGNAYLYQFEVSADQPVSIQTVVQIGEDPWTNTVLQSVDVETAPIKLSIPFVSALDTSIGQVAFQVGGNPRDATICFDNISLTFPSGDQKPGEMLINGGFDDGTATPWNRIGSGAMEVKEGRLCYEVPPDTTNSWDEMIYYKPIQLVYRNYYTVEFEASADKPFNIETNVELGSEPYTQTLYKNVLIGTTSTKFSFDLVSGLETPNGQLTFQFGGNKESATVCLDNISLSMVGIGYKPDTGPAIKVNQVGYVPFGPKRATFVTDATDAQYWVLKSADGSEVASGQTAPFGFDAPSGDTVHIVDFSSYHKPGKGYILQVGEIGSYPFDISGGLYDQLRYDALEFFYHQRSGISILAQYVGEPYARPAGHLGIAPNQGDTEVPCFSGGCDYRRDVQGGWYDAGDQGKYVVGGGIAVWQLVNAYERSSLKGKVAWRDGSQQIPENNNGIPDILDEARWELEFFLRMQVPEGKPFAGMAFHRIHDQQWTALPTRPDLDPQPRHLYPPTTAATLNLAATAAQCGRVWRQWDRVFAHLCLAAAERAWHAALANPTMFTTPSPNGGGEYRDYDGDVSDEFYWAAAELFVTTGKNEYRDFITNSPHYQASGIPADGVIWYRVALLGDMSLALVPNDLSTSYMSGLRTAIVNAADKVIDTMSLQGYGVPYIRTDGNYIWGSNSQVLSQVMLLAVAYELTWEWKYWQAAFEATDYIFGRNGLNQSYVTGYGAKASQNVHHRFWAHEANPAYPLPPAGALAGGPNSVLDDTSMRAWLGGLAPQKCYLDRIEFPKTNEVALNWNSVLVWTSAWLAERSL